MKIRLALSFAVALACVAAFAESVTCASPDGRNILSFTLGARGEPTYSFAYRGKKVVEPSTLGFDIKALGKDAFDGRRPGELRTGFVLAGVERASADETWRPVWGEESEIRDRHEEMLVKLVQKKTGRSMDLRFRVFDDGMGFRYEFPADDDNSVARLVPGENIAPEGKTQPLTHFTIVEERTRFNLPCDATAWWIPADYETQEYRYTKSRVSEIPGLFKGAPDANLSSTLTDFPAVQTALMFRYDDGLLVNIHEAACVEYSTMHLRVDGTSFESSLTPDATGAKGWMQTPCRSPWRTLIVGEKGADILASRITLNLNEPCAIKDTSWIHPVKYIGVWWTMITGAKNWAYMPDPSLHAANTTNVMRHIDFAAEHGFDEVLVEGWDIGFEDWFGKEKDDVFDFVTPYPDFDLEGLNKYAHEKGVKLMMYHETSASTRNYERHLDEAYALMNRYGYDTVKSGYVGNMLPHGDHHYSQWSNNHYLYCIKEAAKRKIMVNQHEAVRPTGLCRTWPNLIGNEAARGTEYESFGGNNADHTTILPFTRLVGGPMDYTPGIFETDLSKICSWKKQRISTTLAGQLALYVTMFSPLQMAADVPESYEKRLDALQFIKDVPCDWDESRYLETEIGDYLTIVRRAKGKDEWYLGMKADENAHEAEIWLDFLTPGKTYEATIYADAPDAVYRTETAGNYVIEKRTVSSSDALRLRAAPGGGAAVSFKPVQSLESLFDDPPQRRGANAWWHWQGANVTKYGITRDLEAMKDAGLSGATIFNIQDVGWSCEERMSTPLCPGMEYMSAKWWEMVKFAVAEAKRLGLELGLHNCPGYSTSGGSWITPELGMKKLVWAKGDAQPEAKLGFYRDIAKVEAKDGVYRFGYTCTGKNTHPSPPEVEAGSLEADKMSERAVALHVDHLLSELAAHGVSASNPGLAFILMDSYEAQDASWTDDFAEELRRRRGYDPVPFLPVLAKLGTGFAPEREEQFRRDFARTKNELQTERHYRVFKERLNAAGFEFHLEPYWGPFDSFEAAQFCDVPMTEFWMGLPFWSQKPSKGGACWFSGPVGRALGRHVTGAESFTGYPLDDPFALTPRDLKVPLDATFARGVNRLSLHHWEHQPLDARWRPGYSMGPWGTHFGENQTWHEPAKGFYRYIQRCQALLQEGVMRCDAIGLACYDEDGTDALPLSSFLTNTEVTAERKLRVKSSGMEYSLLFLEKDAARRFADGTSWDGVEKKCFDLVREYAKKGLRVGKASERTRYFEVASGDGEGVMASCRRAGDAAFFFVANTSKEPRSFTAKFRQTEGRDFQPEIWNPETGEKRRIGEWRTENGVTPVALELPAEGSVFVVFREEGFRFSQRMPDLAVSESALGGPWTLSFDADGGAPTGSVALAELASWTEMAEPGIRYYSGTATYEAKFTVPECHSLALDLGDVRDVAEVFVDGRRIAALWHAPYRVELPHDVARSLGSHALKVRVTNAWTNRLIGDEREPDDCPLTKKVLGFGKRKCADGAVRDIPLGRAVIAFPQEVLENRPRRVPRYAISSWRYLISDDDLRPAGLLGPVKLAIRTASRSEQRAQR